MVTTALDCLLNLLRQYGELDFEKAKAKKNKKGDYGTAGLNKFD